MKPMARKIYRIDEFMGLDQSMGENGMAASYRTASLP